MTSERFRFGLFEFNAGSHELRREGALVRLQLQPGQVLASLLENAGNVVSRDDLRRTVWHDDTFVDFERGLNFCIAQIRAAINDDAASPRFIRTIPKRGYQFIAPLERLAAAAPLPATQLESGNGRKSPAKPAVVRNAIALGFVLLLALSAVGYWWKTRAAANSIPIVAVVRFDNETGDPQATRLSDALTDVVVADLTTAGDGHYRVIGNARMLRRPREERDLRAIASSLGASYVVLGQVQRSADRTRILAHLIHLPEQTHVWVARIDRDTGDALAFESQVAQQITDQFSPKIAARITSRALPAGASR